METLVDEFVELCGTAPRINITPRELRDAIRVHPDLDARVLVKRLQQLIPELLRRGIWFQKDGLTDCLIYNMGEVFDKRSLGFNQMPMELKLAVKYFQGHRFR